MRGARTSRVSRCIGFLSRALGKEQEERALIDMVLRGVRTPSAVF
jgi:hypothetical protein